MYPKSFEELIENLMKLPGVGRKTAERYALNFLEQGEDQILATAKSLIEVKENVKTCQQCHFLSEGDLCEICKDSGRDINQICVVSTSKEVVSIEKIGQYHGLYHVLEGLISTRKGIMPEDLNIQDIKPRIQSKETEIILALNATMEGETTALYISKIFGDNAKITRLAFGLPISGQLDYADDMTLLKAFEGRKKM